MPAQFFMTVYPCTFPVSSAAVQKRAMRIIFPCFSYEEAFVKVSLFTLLGTRQVPTDNIFKKILENKRQLAQEITSPTKYQILQPRQVTQVQSGF